MHTRVVVYGVGLLVVVAAGRCGRPGGCSAAPRPTRTRSTRCRRRRCGRRTPTGARSATAPAARRWAAAPRRPTVAGVPDPRLRPRPDLGLRRRRSRPTRCGGRSASRRSTRSGRRSASARQGQVDVLRLDDGVDLAGVERALRRLGYTPPRGGSGTGGTWVGGPDLVAQTRRRPHAGAAERRGAARRPPRADVGQRGLPVRGGGRSPGATADSLTPRPGCPRLAAAADDPVAAVQWTSTFACEDLTMGSADEGDQQTGERLVAKAGDVSPLEGLVMAQQPDRSLVVGMHFETSDQADREPPDPGRPGLRPGARAGRLVRGPVRGHRPARPTARTSCSPRPRRSRTARCCPTLPPARCCSPPADPRPSDSP